MEEINTKSKTENDSLRSHKLIVVLGIIFVVLTILFIVFLFFLNSNDVKMSSLFASSNSPSEVSQVTIAHEMENRVQNGVHNEQNINIPVENKNTNDIIPPENESHGIVAPPVTDRIEKLAIIKTTMQSNYTAAIKCKQRGGEVLSSEKSGKICSEPTSSGGTIVWAGPTFCGDSYYDTKWIVFNGDTNQWDFTMECNGFTECNGPEGAICNAQGCQFHCENTDNIDMLTTGMMDIRMEAIQCHSRGGAILSSDRSSNSVLCSIAGKDTHVLWPQYDFCGPERGDTKWLVQANGANEWTYTVECKNFTECNGLQGAFCNSDRCVFHCAEGESDSDGATIVEIDL